MKSKIIKLAVLILITGCVFTSCKKDVIPADPPSLVPDTKEYTMDVNFTADFVVTSNWWDDEEKFQSSGIDTVTISNGSSSSTFVALILIYQLHDARTNYYFSRVEIKDAFNYNDRILLDNLTIYFPALQYSSGVAFAGTCTSYKGFGKFARLTANSENLKLSGTADRLNKSLQSHLSGKLFF